MGPVSLFGKHQGYMTSKCQLTTSGKGIFLHIGHWARREGGLRAKVLVFGIIISPSLIRIVKFERHR